MGVQVHMWGSDNRGEAEEYGGWDDARSHVRFGVLWDAQEYFLKIS